MSSSRPVAIWIYTGVIMLLVQFILGGITRLTGSGLSITEWDLGKGILPPLNHAQWMVAFDKYRQTPQFRILNADFTLSDFKFIFFWEWSHRFWARLVALVFVVGFVWLLRKKMMKAQMVRPLLILFLLGALQGAVGWIMVASGLTGDAIYVVPTRLALHFVFACGLVVYTFWFALELSVDPDAIRGRAGGVGDPKAGSGSRGGPDDRSIRRLRAWTIAILILLFFQLLYGALMAGHKAAAVAPTWPTINGAWWPESLFNRRPLTTDLVGNTLTVQFLHRGMAYGLLILVLVWTVLSLRLREVGPGFRKVRWLPLGFIVLQILLGIGSLLASPGIIPNRWLVFNWLAQFHQVVGLIFLLTITGMLYLVRPYNRTI